LVKRKENSITVDEEFGSDVWFSLKVILFRDMRDTEMRLINLKDIYLKDLFIYLYSSIYYYSSIIRSIYIV